MNGRVAALDETRGYTLVVRLDRLDPYLKTFTASITGVTRDSEGAWFSLDRSAFYPTAGGQQHDTGTFAGHAVTDVKVEDGVVWHLVPEADGGVLGVGSVVDCAIDWDRRFRHMQRHTGQHLLSQAFVRVGAARGRDFATRSVSLRGPDCTLDLAGEPDDEACAAAAAEADAAARRAMPVSCFEVEERFLHEYDLRRPSKVTGSVRLVAIGDYDLAACGGTHVANSAELLPLIVLGSERVKSDLTRVTFRAGSEAVADAAAKQAVVARLGVELSAQPADLPAHVARLRADLGQARAQLDSAHALAASGLADAALRGASVAGAVRVVSVALRGDEALLLDALVERFQGLEGVVALCGSAVDGRARLAFTAGPGTGVDVRPALKAALESVEGRGGGRPDRAMGAGQRVAGLEEAMATAARVLGVQ